jgi:ATP-dependent DNA ligase
MLARLADELPRGDYLYEPKWDGFRCLAFRDGEAVQLWSRHRRELTRYFPEVVDALRALNERRVVLDGELIVPGREFAALMARIHPAASRVDRLRRETPACFVAFDMLAIGDRDLRGRPFAERRSLLERLDGVEVTPTTRDPDEAAAWLGGAPDGAIDGVVAKSAELRYRAGDRAMVKVKTRRTADCVVAGFRWLASAPLPSTLVLALYDGGQLVHVGVAGGFATAERRRVLEHVAPFAVELDTHPWRDGFPLAGTGNPTGRLKGSAGRWTPDLPQDWVPLRPELVCEVAFDRVDDGRFRHPARFVRWRPDRDARSCALDQL